MRARLLGAHPVHCQMFRTPTGCNSRFPHVSQTIISPSKYSRWSQGDRGVREKAELPMIKNHLLRNTDAQMGMCAHT
jgi:hypothetical protein